MDSKIEFRIFLEFLRNGHKEEASEALRKILTLAPEKAEPYALLIGGMLAQNGQYREAVSLYEEAIRLNADDPPAYFYLGATYHALHEDGECNRIWDQLADRFPNHGLNYYQAALRALKLDQYADAKANLQKAIERIEPDNPLRNDALKTLALIEHKFESH